MSDGEQLDASFTARPAHREREWLLDAQLSDCCRIKRPHRLLPRFCLPVARVSGSRPYLVESKGPATSTVDRIRKAAISAPKGSDTRRSGLPGGNVLDFCFAKHTALGKRVDAVNGGSLVGRGFGHDIR